MAEKKFAPTEQQKQAIDCRGHQLIVSAAAGSGKTAVLSKRVLALISDPEHPCNVDRLLILTFSKAAAAEMRGRIADELGAMLAENPGDRNLHRQLALLPQARIQTVHSFCQSLIRQNFHLCNVSPDFRQGDEIEFAQLKQLAVDQLLEEAYADASPVFLQLADQFFDQRSDRLLAQFILEIHNKLRSHPDPETWLQMIPIQLSGDPVNAAWYRNVMESVRQRCKKLRADMEDGLDQMSSDAKLLTAYGPAFTIYRDFLIRLEEAADLGWDAVRQLLRGFDVPSLSSKKSEDKELRARMKARHDKCKANVAAMRDNTFAVSLEILRQESAAQGTLVAELCRLVQRFTELYDEEKARRNLLDFSDLEHKALELLTDAEGKPSRLALELRQELSEVLVDEYQDTNEIQERIFAAVMPHTGSAFFVGDVKQSIYGFRLADPTIFRSRYRESARYGTEGASHWRMELNRNFRSRPEVLNLCNFVFFRVMSEEFGDVNYDEGQSLVPGKPAEGRVESELLLLSGKGSDEKRMESEARLVAAEIRRLLDTPAADGSRRRPEDFAILFSSFSTRAPVYEAALRALNIPCGSAEESDFFESIEISVLLSLLRIIDNRRQDIPLISVLRSPLYFFSPDALGRIRMAASGSLCDGLEARAAEDPACAAVLKDLDAWCALAKDSTVAQLIWQIYRKTNAPAVFSALEGGARRRENLRQFYRLALAFETAGARGLHAFLRHIDGRIAEGKAPAAEAAGGVQIMSIHRSKGLEFPVVFLPDLSKMFNQDDLRKQVLFHPDIGIALPDYDAENRVKYKTQLQRAIVERTQGELRAEELRKLYVAMTRAKEKLVLVISVSNAETRLKNIAAIASEEALDPMDMRNCSNSADWILSALMTHPEAQELRDGSKGAGFICAPAIPANTGLKCRLLKAEEIAAAEPYCPVSVEETETDREEAASLLALSEQTYAHLAASALPSKLTPTGAAKRLPESGTAVGAPRQVKIKLGSEPALSREDALLRGTAFHRALEHLVPEDAAEDAALLAAVERLTAEGKLSPEQQKMLNLPQLAAWLQSDLALRTVACKQVLREYEFAALIPADRILHNGVEDAVLLNGAIDLLMEEDDGLVILDFKTDRVSPDALEARAQHHALQLSLYGMAAEAIFQKTVKETWVWFLRAGKGVRLS